MVAIVCVALGSALGGVLRYLISMVSLRAEGWLPLSAVWSTVLINILGSFAIGWIGTATAHGSRMQLPESGRLFLIVGICGGFTTFSSFSLQTFDLYRHGMPVRALLNVIVSVLMCLGAVALGHKLGQKSPHTPEVVAQTGLEDRAS